MPATLRPLPMPAMRMLRALLLTLCACACGAATAEEAREKFAMRWRVFCDKATGTAFRYPYELFPVDQYKGNLRRERRLSESFRVVEQKGDKTILERIPAKPGDDRLDIHHFTFSAADVGIEAPTLQAIGDREAGSTLEWKPWDYYRSSPTRPWADAKWADEGIEAMLAENDAMTVLVVKHRDRWSGLMLKGNLSSGDNARIVDSFEVLSTGRRMKLADKTNPKAKLVTWYEHHNKSKVIDAAGKLVAPDAKAQPVAWKQGWEIETEHYHVTTSHNPARLLQHGQLLEGLYRAYSKVYQPDSMPPYKFEVHIYSKYREFGEAAAAWGNALPQGGGGIVGGFFVPSLLSLWVYEESGALGGDDFTVEHVTAHECSHQFLHVACNGSEHVPTWINEGLAVYFENGIFQNNEFQVRSPVERIMQLKNVYQQQKQTLQPLDDYLEHKGHISAMQYGEVFAMTSFWVFGTCAPDPALCKHKNCGLKRFREYFTALRQKEDGAKAFERIFMEDMVKAQGGRDAAIAAWQKALLEYVEKRLK